MRKTLMILALLIFVLPLSAYSVNALKNSNVRQKQLLEIQARDNLIKNNQKHWKQLTKGADVIHSDEFGNNNHAAGITLDQLKNHNKALIKGTVYNLQKMNSPQNMAYTKATIHVDRVISGDESLKNKNVYVVFNGGLVSFNHWYSNVNRPKNLDRKMLVKNDEFPIPNIGSKIITGFIPNHLDEPLEYNDSLKQSGFTIHNSYALDSPQYNFWVKNSNEKSYHLNNPKIRQKKIRNGYLADQLQVLTAEINKQYNK